MSWHGQLAGRFIRHFESIATPERLIVAPKALSRFYERYRARHTRIRTWARTLMTREDRLGDIKDNVEYLDALYARIFASLDGACRHRRARLLAGWRHGRALARAPNVHVDRALL